ncbi:hypothetical protein OAC06_08330 [Alphaproteobacteria bacterium]|nr:hypothetical protein [Alphaproteobacteria bacterium]
MSNNKSIQEIIEGMSVGKRKYEEKKAIKKGFKSLEESIQNGINMLEKPSKVKENNIKKPLVKDSKKEAIKVKKDEAIWKQTNKKKSAFNPLSFGKGNNKTTNILKNRKVGGGS